MYIFYLSRLRFNLVIGNKRKLHLRGYFRLGWSFKNILKYSFFSFFYILSQDKYIYLETECFTVF